MQTTTPQPGYNTYGFLNGEGIAWALVFVIMFLGRRRHAEYGIGRRVTRGDDA